MNKILIILSLFTMACSNNASHEITHENEHERDTGKVANVLQLNNGARWKTDEVTRKNVAAIVRLINDTSNVEKKTPEQVTKQLLAMIDTLVSQCKMTGPDHDALHVWLGQVLNDIKAMKEGKDDSAYQLSYAALKNDVKKFYSYFD